MPIEAVKQGRLLRITLNRPEKRNALNLELCRALNGALSAANQDAGIGAVLLNGAGKAFCAGMDLSEARDVDRNELSEAHQRIFTFYEWMNKPVIAAVHGAALAGGTGVAANAHILIAAEDATFGLTEIRIGLWPVLIYPPVVRAFGERRTLELALTGRLVNARDAERGGLVHETVTADSLMARAEEIARAVAESSAVAVRSGLEYRRQMGTHSPEEVYRIGRSIRDQILEHADFAEGVKAFQEKRAPVWPSIS